MIPAAEFDHEVSHIVDDYRRSFEPQSSDWCRDGGKFLAVHLVNVEGFTVFSTGNQRAGDSADAAAGVPGGEVGICPWIPGLLENIEPFDHGRASDDGKRSHDS